MLCFLLVPQSAAAAPVHAEIAYAYDSQVNAAARECATSERGPPTPDRNVDSTYDAVDRWSHGASARSSSATTHATYVYDDPALLAQVGGSAGTAREPAEARNGDHSSRQRSRVAANTGKALELSPASLNYPWPANNGFLGSTRVRVLKPGAQIDRYGPETGRFTSPAGTPRGMRSLRPGTTSDLSSYEVVRRLPAETGVVAPGFGETGLGIQYRLPAPVADLVRAGYLRPVG